MANVYMEEELGTLMLRSEAEWLHERIATVSSQTRARLAAAARDILANADREARGTGDNVLWAADRLESLANGRFS